LPTSAATRTCRCPPAASPRSSPSTSNCCWRCGAPRSEPRTTNLLFDLVVAAHHGAFDDHAAVARLLRADTTVHDGRTVALRSIADPRPRRGSYSSLRDTTLLNDLARQKGPL
jgi:hypothetical protein